MDWLRLYHEAVTDPKIGMVADSMGAPPALAMGIWTSLLCFASASPIRGKLLAGVDVPITDRAISRVTGIDDITPWIAAFEQHGMIARDGNCWQIVNWGKRQFVSDDSSQRWQEWKRQRAANTATTTPTNVGAPLAQRGNSSTESDTESETDLIDCDAEPPLLMPVSEQVKLVELRDVGISDAVGMTLVEKCTLPRIRAVIAHARASPRLSNPTGYIVSMLKSGQALPGAPLPGGNHGTADPSRRRNGPRGSPTDAEWADLAKQYNGASLVAG